MIEGKVKLEDNWKRSNTRFPAFDYLEISHLARLFQGFHLAKLIALIWLCDNIYIQKLS